MIGRRQGSVKNKIVASDLAEERAKCDFDTQEMLRFVNGGQAALDQNNKIMETLKQHPELHNTI